MGYWLHFVYQNHHIPPGIALGLRTANELIPNGERAFMQASDYKAASDGYIGLKACNFSGNDGKE